MSVANRNGRLMQKEQHVDYGKEMGSEKELDGLIWRPVLVKIVVIKLPHKSVFSVTGLLFMSLLCIFIGRTNFF